MGLFRKRDQATIEKRLVHPPSGKPVHPWLGPGGEECWDVVLTYHPTADGRSVREEAWSRSEGIPGRTCRSMYTGKGEGNYLVSFAFYDSSVQFRELADSIAGVRTARIEPSHYWVQGLNMGFSE